MIQQFMEWLHAIGLPGLLIAMFLEGSSLPFPGVILVFSYGFLFSPGYLGTALYAVGMSLTYSIASLIPYLLGMKVGKVLPKRLHKGLQKGKSFSSGMGYGASHYPARSVLEIIYRMLLA